MNWVKIEYTIHCKLLDEKPKTNSPNDYFYLIADENLFDLIVNETNKYAEKVFLAGAQEIKITQLLKI